ncbi:MAG: phosphatidylserine/phosphatidylglycerophosphate/cardiolipin synthase family protein [Deltaproteobacteria bacterium]|nr:phosphatidylserine/phosphatidylglycerophosphate/cardiolipin synthase family protein [Deltaproteobacteria bacterium]
MTENNKIDLLVGGDEAFPKIFEAIDGAKESLNVSYYIFKNDPTGNTFADKLIDAEKRGVDVNISVDGIGSMQVVPESRAILNRLEAGGVNVMRNHVVDFARSGPVFNHPDHRKLVLVDGKTAFTGGMNVADHYVCEYHDVMVQIQGPVVQQMQSEWALSWMNLGGATLNESGASRQEMKDKLFPEPVSSEKAEGAGMKARVTQGIPGHNKEIFTEVLNLINDAKDSIFIENPYCTNPEIQNALIDAGKRGIEIHVVLPGESDHAFSHMAARAKYPEMLAAGVHIHEYPGFNHGKFMVVDEEKVSIGSSNFDDVALRHIYELNINCDDKDFAKSIKERLFDVDIPKCREMKPEDITPMQQATGAFWNLFHDVI